MIFLDSKKETLWSGVPFLFWFSQPSDNIILSSVFHSLNVFIKLAHKNPFDSKNNLVREDTRRL